MREGSASTVRIGRLRLRVPGASREDGRGLATAVSSRLAESLSPTADRRVGGLRVRVPVEARSSASETADAIAAAVAARLGGARDA